MSAASISSYTREVSDRILSRPALASAQVSQLRRPASGPRTVAGWAAGVDTLGKTIEGITIHTPPEYGGNQSAPRASYAQPSKDNPVNQHTSRLTSLDAAARQLRLKADRLDRLDERIRDGAITPHRAAIDLDAVADELRHLGQLLRSAAQSWQRGATTESSREDSS